MANYYQIPLTPEPDQSFSCTLPIDGHNATLLLRFRYNTEAEYWWMSISDNHNKLILDAIPLVTGNYPASDLLRQFGYIGFGSAAIVPTSVLHSDRPDDTNLGTDYVLVWGDRVDQ